MSFLYGFPPGNTSPYVPQNFGTEYQRLIQTNNIYYPHLPSYIDYAKNALQIENPIDRESIEKIIGKKGTMQDGVLKFTFPRYDLKVSIGPVSIEPELALTSWMAFHNVGNQSMVMGDIVLLENEIDPVASQLIANGFKITALHNHLLHELPRIMYLHFSGIGDAVKLAQGIKNVFSMTKTPLTGHTTSQTLPQEYWSAVEIIMGKKGNCVGKVIQFSFPRADKIREFGMEIPPSMGISQAINFQAEGENAATTGDFVLIAKEVNPVIRTLKENGITVTAIHNHMLYESPRLFFLHFWAVDNPEKLAYALRQALGRTNTVRS
ncbi:MAG: DUF1259 domain-containing protein [Ignavibacteriales bacterium]